MDFQVNLAGVRAGVGSVDVNLPHLSFSGHVSNSRDLPPVFNGILEMKKMSLLHRAKRLKLDGAGCRVPLVWPSDAPGAKGSFAVPEIWLDDLSLGTLSGTVRQKGAGALFSGIHESLPVPGLKALFSGALEMPPGGGQSAPSSASQSNGTPKCCARANPMATDGMVPFSILRMCSGLQPTARATSV